MGELGVEWTCRRGRVGDGVEGRGLIDAINRFRQMLADVADITDGPYVGSELLLKLQIELLNERRTELGGFCHEAQAGDLVEGREVWHRRSWQTFLKGRRCADRRTV